MNYEESIEWLNTIPLSFDRNNKNYEFKLDGIKAFLSHLDNPHSQLKIIHVGGTNGKGSTCSIISSILQESGYKIGAFTSPHIKDYRERIRIGKNFIEKDFILEFIRTNNLKIEELGLTYFEISFAMAVDYFAKKKVDYTILEVGLGGRLDATNVVEPVISVITNIGYDHKEFLGNSLEEIAIEKAGIIKYNVPVVVGEKKEKLQDLIKIEANKKSASIYFSRLNKEYKSDMSGPFIQKNISLALKVLDILNLGIKENDILNGILNIKKNTKIYSRWEFISKKPKIIFDSGHNISALKISLSELKNSSKVVFGTLEKKDQIDIIKILPINFRYYFCPVKSDRSMSIYKIDNEAKKIGLKYSLFKNINDALNTAIEDSDENDTILVTGSTFLFSDLY
ncbi:bifunctional folylpolyglutamate synthase/dihydrofolate synthase [Flavobacteriales bacterium]|nr:bifunctional folylpolyglutamate synthase/dihydrofolate synthase [Flavobacteriales bacterium]